jgi:hypothetical protein
MEPSLWKRARKAFRAAGMAGLAAATPTFVAVQDGGLTWVEIGTVLGAFVVAAVPTFAVVMVTGNVPSTEDLAAAQRARREALR